MWPLALSSLDLRKDFLDNGPAGIIAGSRACQGNSPPRWRHQLSGLLSADAHGTVQEFHDFLCSLAGRQSRDCEFTSLCAAILSAQTHDRSAIDATKHLAACFGFSGNLGLNPAALAFAPLETISRCLKSVNFYRSKAKRLRETAAALLSQHSGRVPVNFEALVALPGVGPKIANLVLSVTFQQAECGMVVDTHVHRVSGRLGWSTFAEPEQTRLCLEGFIPAEMREIVARRMIGFGQEICKPRNPACRVCPLAKELCPSVSGERQRVHAVRAAGPRPWKLRPSGPKRTIIEISVES